ncbi:protoporphyrinogen oxidase [Gordonia sinesedis]
MNTRDETCDVVVVGAGMAGLMAATTLKDRADVMVLEANDRPGGRVESVRHGDYWINVGTQFTEGTGTLIDALDRHEIGRGTLAGKKVGLDLNGGLVDTANPLALMFRTRMSWAERFGMAVMGARIIGAAAGLDPRLERTKVGRWARATLDRRAASFAVRGVRSEVPNAMLRSWTGQWMGCDPDETAATQFVASMSVALADPGTVPNFSLPDGGNQTLTDVLADDLGDRLRLGADVRAVESTGPDGDVVVHYTDATGPVRVTARRAIVAVPADVATSIVAGLPDRYRQAFGDIGYGRYVVVGYFTEEQGAQWWDDFYAVSTPLLEFQAVFNHAAAIRDGARRPGGALACFAGGGKADALLERSDDEIIELFSRDLVTVLPELRGKLGTPVVRRHHRVVPYWAPGARDSVATLRQPLGSIHFAGDYLLDMPSLADAAESGEQAATAVLESL